ncbi:hypothetical protein D0T84_02305 [Dysgonomonas sp. 521]|uniref:LamG-like jellyroll fold domain-containing protein n=1 Tax=Dysgonomonas sp. 521 TaxID=2302932 RepID=UPI0013D4391D|nr:LamG-like jellyroll fold domain-containing protein [Dysgonomonas sp. 521]NDV93751.1 hypothetical protein [Dysgonomonas sp. 521]
MKNIFKLLTVFTVICFSSCQEWGEWDEPAGNQVYPTLEKLATYAFDEELEFETFEHLLYPDGNKPELIEDNERDTVLHLNGGYVRIANPLNSVEVQSAVSLTFWYKQAVAEDGSQDLQGAIFSFGNEDISQRMFFTANGWLNYKGVDGTYSYNDPASVKTGMITPGEWHYVAISVTNSGYYVYVDGERKIDRNETGFDCSKIVQSMASLPYLYIGYGSDVQTSEMWIDDLTIYRNEITDAQIRVPDNGGGEVDNKNYIIVGNEDFSTGWWSAFSDLVRMKGNNTTHYGFYNYTNGNANWNNWLLVATNGKDRNEAGYAEYFVMRADAFGWGDGNYNGDNISHNFNFDDGSFTTDMQGAYVDLTVKRTDNRIDMKAVVTATNGTVYTYTYYYEGDVAESIGTFLTCEGSYLKIDPEAVFIGESYTPGSYLVGPADCSAGWWSSFSDFSKISDAYTTYPFVYTFINNNNNGANWNNWLLVLTNGKNRDEVGYAEYFVLRADAFGWGDGSYTGDNISASYNWDTYVGQMKGATCKIILTRSGDRLDMTAKVTTAEGEELEDYTFYYQGITTSEIGMFLTVELASLDMRAVGYYPFWSAIE